jgi:polysaccharide biosynthesis/export protein
MIRGASPLKGRILVWGSRYLVPFIVLAVLFHRTLCVSAQDVSVVGTPQEANDKIRTLGKESKSSPHEYTIGNGDLLSITVFDVPDLTRDIRVSQTGTISMPLVPTRLHITGLTESQAEQMIADVLQANGLVSHPEVGVMVKEHKSRPITIVGAVMHPMVYEADSSVTLLEALAEAGGVSVDAGDTIIVTRGHASSFVMVPNPEPVSTPAPGAASSANSNASDATVPAAETANSSAAAAFPSASEMNQTQTTAPPMDSSAPPSTASAAGNVITINLNELIEKGDTRNNIPLLAGDVVTVPHAGIIYVLGAVNRPGGFVLSNDRTQLTTMKVLSLAGGLTKIAKLDHAVIIRKDGTGKQTETEVDLSSILKQKTEDIQMRASDVLYIPDNHVKEVLLTALQISVAVATAVAIYRIGYRN